MSKLSKTKVEVRIDTDLAEQLRSLSKSSNKTMVYIVSKALKDFFVKRKHNHPEQLHLFGEFYDRL